MIALGRDPDAELGGQGTVPAAGTLLSRGRPVTASSAGNAVFPAAAAVDGGGEDRWSSAFGDPQWLQADTGSPATINRAVPDWDGSGQEGLSYPSAG
ncbi:discoidin domain-containing protein [Streptosporangium minutum]|uniref:F5/8 type C domain-containing protein n=1 Tax=Streptosporangium minutum TaxID=569862 RepID=A0A243RBM7_9ACTN|nr:discoidin domain-containing protein [Streptosporangium minutum]OUC92071.1 hypothetical protein CA984_31490 [Streptosporangium minutum]